MCPCVPCCQLVAVKYLAVYDTGARHQLAQELKSLYANLGSLGGSTQGLSQGPTRGIADAAVAGAREAQWLKRDLGSACWACCAS